MREGPDRQTGFCVAGIKVLDFGLAKLTGPAEAGHYVEPGVLPDVRHVRLQAGHYVLTAPRTPPWRRALPYGAAVAVTAAGAGYAAWALKPAPAASVTRFSITLPEGEAFTNIGRHLVALSPDGTRLAYAANNRLYLRSLDQFDAAPICGTEGTGNAIPRSPFFSLDGQWIGFWADGQLK